jgi:hypothetical protein
MVGILLVVYTKIRSMEPHTITTEEFKSFQNSFLIGNGLMCLGEILALASFYPTFLALDCKIEDITKLYLIYIVSTAVFAVLLEIIDFGTRKGKCVTSAILYFVSLFSLCCDDHYDMLMLGRVCYGAATALHHGLDMGNGTFENYAIHQHTTAGFPDEWLNNTFVTMTHTVAAIAVVAGFLGQLSSATGGLGTISLVCILFLVAAVYMHLKWEKDTVGAPRFLMSQFISNTKQTLETLKTNRTVLFILGISALFESAIMIFTFYWAPWIASVTIRGDEKDEASLLPYELIYAIFIMSSMLGNYVHGMYSSQIGSDYAFQLALVGSSGLFFLGSFIFSSYMALLVAIAIQFAIGGYWPCIATLRGRFIPSELRVASATLTRLCTLLLVIFVLHLCHDSTILVMCGCAALTGGAAYLQVMMSRMHIDDDGMLDEDMYEKNTE